MDIQVIINFFKNIIGDLGNWLSNLSIGDILSGTVGIIPRSIIFFRTLLNPIYSFIGSYFGFIASGLFFSVIGFICILAIRRGVFK